MHVDFISSWNVSDVMFEDCVCVSWHTTKTRKLALEFQEDRSDSRFVIVTFAYTVYRRSLQTGSSDKDWTRLQGCPVICITWPYIFQIFVTIFVNEWGSVIS